MEIMANNYMPGDSRLIDQIVYELKSQGIFDQFRKECIADVDTKPAYQNLRQRVEGSVTGFLKKQTWKPDMNKNHVREMLRKNIHESGFLETGVERIVDQVVNPKINTVFLPQVEDVVYRFLGIQKPNRNEDKNLTRQLKVNIFENLLPTDLEAVSPESDTNEMKFDQNTVSPPPPELNDSKMDDDESPPFEPLDDQLPYVPQEENSGDSHLSGFSGLASHDSNHSQDTKVLQMDISNQDSQQSKHSFEEHFSTMVSDDNETKMEICEDSHQSKSSKSLDSNPKFDFTQDSQTNSEKSSNSVKQDKKTETPKIEEKKNDKSRSSSKHTSRRDSKSDKKDEKDKKSDSKDKKEHKDRHSNSKESKLGDRSKDRKDSRSSSSKHESKSGKDREKNDTKDKETRNDKDKNDKYKDKSDTKDKENRNEKDKSEKDKERSKNRHSSGSRDKNNTRKDSHSKEKSSENRDKSSDKSKSSNSRERKDSKSKDRGDEKHSKSDKYKKDEKHHSHSSSRSKDKKDVKKESKKDPKDDHFSSKIKKHDRRSTDRDSNDGHSNIKTPSNSFTSSVSSSQTEKNQDSSASNSGTGSGESGNSDNAEMDAMSTENMETSAVEQMQEMHQTIKIIKPKFASNIHEAKRLMKIRKRLDKIEKQKQLALDLATNNPNVASKHWDPLTVCQNGLIAAMNLENESLTSANQKKRPNILKKQSSLEALKLEIPKADVQGAEKSPELISPPLQNSIITKESWDALEAKLNETVLNTNYDSYEDYSEHNSDEVVVVQPAKSESSTQSKKEVEKPKIEEQKPTEIEESNDSKTPEVDEKSDDLNKPHKNNGTVDTSSENLNLPEESSVPETTEDSKSAQLTQIAASCSSVRSSISDESKCSSDCICFDSMLLPESQRYLKFACTEIKKLEESISNLSSEMSPLSTRRNPKRKLSESCTDVKNNNKRHNSQTSPVAATVKNDSVSSGTRKSIKSLPTVVVQSDTFPLPLSPAESEKSIDKKIDVPETQNKRNTASTRSANTAAKNSQRYSSDDLYKPRPLISGSRRRGNRNANLD